MGADGVWVSWDKGRERIPGHRVDAIDATGAGDCFDGAFAARIVAGDDAVAAARYANAAAALATTGYGAVDPLPTQTDVAAFMKRSVQSAQAGSAPIFFSATWQCSAVVPVVFARRARGRWRRRVTRQPSQPQRLP